MLSGSAAHTRIRLNQMFLIEPALLITKVDNSKYMFRSTFYKTFSLKACIVLYNVVTCPYKQTRHDMNLIQILQAKARNFSDALLMETLNQPKLKKHILDWENWTEPVSYAVAEEAFKRGLI